MMSHLPLNFYLCKSVKNLGQYNCLLIQCQKASGASKQRRSAGSMKLCLIEHSVLETRALIGCQGSLPGGSYSFASMRNNVLHWIENYSSKSAHLLIHGLLLLQTLLHRTRMLFLSHVADVFGWFSVMGPFRTTPFPGSRMPTRPQAHCQWWRLCGGWPIHHKVRWDRQVTTRTNVWSASIWIYLVFC